MKRLLIALALLLPLPAHAQQTKAALTTEINTNFATGVPGGITAATTRTTILDILNSIMPTAPVGAGNLACFSGTTGLLSDCGSSPTTLTLPIANITGFGTSVATALAVNVGTAGAPVINGGALGTPSAGVGTNLTGTAAGLTAGNVTTNANLTGPVTSVGNATAVTNNAITRAMEAQGIARSVIGVTGNAGANVADIQGTANQFLGVNSAGTALAFGTMSQDCTLATAVITCTQSAGDFKVTGLLQTGGDSRVTTQFDKTSSTVLGDVPGLSATLTSGLTYGFDVLLYTASNSASGVKCTMAGTVTATAVTFTESSIGSAGLSAYGRHTSLGSTVTGATAVTDVTMHISGTITVNVGGTLTAQFAQNVSGGVASSVLVGSTMRVWKIQ